MKRRRAGEGRRGDVLSAAKARAIVESLPVPPACDGCGQDRVLYSFRFGPHRLHLCAPCVGQITHPLRKDLQ